MCSVFNCRLYEKFGESALRSLIRFYPSILPSDVMQLCHHNPVQFLAYLDSLVKSRPEDQRWEGKNICRLSFFFYKDFPFLCGSAGKESACNVGSIPGLGRSPGGGNSYPLQHSGLENSMDCIVHGFAKSQTGLSDFHFLLIEHCFSHIVSWNLFTVNCCRIEVPAVEEEDFGSHVRLFHKSQCTSQMYT